MLNASSKPIISSIRKVILGGTNLVLVFEKGRNATLFSRKLALLARYNIQHPLKVVIVSVYIIFLNPRYMLELQTIVWAINFPDWRGLSL